MILLDIQTRVKRTFGDESGAQIDDNDIARWASDAQLDIVRETKCLLDTNSQAFAAGGSYFQIPRAISIQTVTVDGAALKGITSQELNMRFPDRFVSSTRGTPQFFLARDDPAGTIVDIYPFPVAAGTMLCTYNGRPLPVVNPNDAFSVPEQYQDIIYRKCLERAYETDGQWNAAKTMQMDAAEKTSRARADSKDKDDSSYPSVRCLPWDCGN